MTDLMGAGVAEVIGSRRAAGQRFVEHDHAVHLRVVGVLVRERRPAQQGAEIEDVEVERPGPAFAEGGLHLGLLRVAELHRSPARVDRHVGVDQLEDDPGVLASDRAAVEGVVEDIDLGDDPLHGDDADRGALLDHVDVDGDLHGTGGPRLLPRSRAGGQRALIGRLDVGLHHARRSRFLRDAARGRRLGAERERVAVEDAGRIVVAAGRGGSEPDDGDRGCQRCEDGSSESHAADPIRAGRLVKARSRSAGGRAPRRASGSRRRRGGPRRLSGPVPSSRARPGRRARRESRSPAPRDRGRSTRSGG